MNASTNIPPGYMRMGNRLVRAQASFGTPKQKSRKFLLVLQHYEGDRDAAEQLASLIADLERTRNHDADVMLMRRADSRELSAQIVQKLQTKFDKVLMHACRRIDAKSYPMAPNQMWSDLVMLMAQNLPYATDYYAFINLETDCVPTRPGWIGELIEAWKAAMAEGKAAVGHIETDPHHHLNGLAVYASDLYRRAGGNTLAGGNPQVTYDIRFARTILPMAKDTPLVYFKYRQPTITPDDLFAPKKEGIAPALYHGVKDGSARAAVRARHITFTNPKPVVIVHQPNPAPVLAATIVQDPTDFTPESKPLGVAAAIRAEEASLKTFEAPTRELIGELGNVENLMGDADAGNGVVRLLPSIPPNPNEIVLGQTPFPQPTTPAKRPNVYTYSHKHDGVTKAEMNAILAAWTKGWTSRGWNPVVLTLRDAAKHPKFEQFQAAVEKLPCVGDKKRMAHRFYRWLALDMAGGGLLTDWDVLPGEISPDKLAVFVGPNDAPLIMLKEAGVFLLWLDQSKTAGWISAIMAYDAQPEDLSGKKPHVTDRTVASHMDWFTTSEFKSDDITHFQPPTNERKSVAMERFLAGK